MQDLIVLMMGRLVRGLRLDHRKTVVWLTFLDYFHPVLCMAVDRMHGMPVLSDGVITTCSYFGRAFDGCYTTALWTVVQLSITVYSGVESPTARRE